MKELNANQQFHLAYATRMADQPGYRGRIDGRVLVDGGQKSVLARLVKRGYGTFSKDEGWTYFVPNDRSRQLAKKYKPDTPQRKVMMWMIRAPQLKTMAKFINGHLPKFEATIQDSSYTPSHKIKGTRLSSYGQTKMGKKMVVNHRSIKKRGRYPVLEINGPDPDDYNGKVVNWIADKMGVRAP